MPHKWPKVQFEFVSLAGDAYTYSGTVRVPDGGMVLEVECPGYRPYLILGEAVDGFFRGTHKEQPGDSPIAAKWIRLDDIFIGTWKEDRTEYLFKFDLPEGTDG